MKRKAGKPDQRTASVKNQEQNGTIILEDGPIIIKGGSVSIRYKRTSFRPREEWNDHVDNGTGSQKRITLVTIMNDDTGQILYEASPNQNCSITVRYA